MRKAFECGVCGFYGPRRDFDESGMDDVCPSCGSHHVEEVEICEVCGEPYLEDYSRLEEGESVPATRLCVIETDEDTADCRVHLADPTEEMAKILNRFYGGDDTDEFRDILVDEAADIGPRRGRDEDRVQRFRRRLALDRKTSSRAPIGKIGHRLEEDPE